MKTTPKRACKLTFTALFICVALAACNPAPQNSEDSSSKFTCRVRATATAVQDQVQDVSWYRGLSTRLQHFVQTKDVTSKHLRSSQPSLLALINQECLTKNIAALYPNENTQRNNQNRFRNAARMRKAFPVTLAPPQGQPLSIELLHTYLNENPCVEQLDLADVVQLDLAHEHFPKRTSTPALSQHPKSAVQTGLSSPNDPQISRQTHLSAINAQEAWSFFDPHITQAATVAVIDSGVLLTHPDLSQNLWTNPNEIAGNGIDDDNNGYIDDVYGYNFADGIPSPMPVAWTGEDAGAEIHGTHVAGIIAARANNSIGVVGVMGQNIQLMSLNAFGSSPAGSSAAIINAINYAVANGAEVINMSLGSGGINLTMQTALQNAISAGVFVAVSAGNNGQELSDTFQKSPASFGSIMNGLMTVGSYDLTTGTFSSFSNFSTRHVELAAPGSEASSDGILSTFSNNSYSRLQGTSMSTPMVSGAAALAIAFNKSKRQSITPAEIEAMLKASSNPIGNLTGHFQNGLIDLASMAAYTSGACD